MNNLNESEIKAVRLIEELRSALNANNQTRVDEMRDSLQNLNPTEIRQSILDQFDELFEHANY